MLKKGEFYVFNGKPVSIDEELEKGAVKITHITRFSDENGDIIREPRKEIVDASKLKLLTKDLAKKLFDEYNKIIGDCNIVKHAIKDCLNYM